MNVFLFILVIGRMLITMGVLADLMTEPPAIEFNVETNQAVGTLIGSIRDYSSNHMQPPYYVIPIQPDNQDLFNRDILIDIDTGRISSNSVLDSNRISQYKCSVLSINEGLATLVVINVIDSKSLKSNETKENVKDESSNRIFNENKCSKLESNKAISVNNDLKAIYNCFQIEFEPIDLSEISCGSNTYWTGVVSIECDKEANVNLVYLDRKLVESFQYDNSTFEQLKLNRIISEFNLTRTTDNTFKINFECDRAKFEFDLNVNLLNQSINQSLNSDLYNNNESDLINKDLSLNSYFKYNDQKNKSKILILSYRQNQSAIEHCSNHSDNNNNISSLDEDFLNSTTTTTATTFTDFHETTSHYKIIKIETFSQNLKTCLIILSVLILSLALLLYGLFIWYKQDSSSKNETSKQFTSSSNLTYKTQTSTINSKYNENTNEDDDDTNPNYFSLIVSQFQRNPTTKTNKNDLNENTIKSFNSSQNNSNLLLSQTKPDSDGLFSYSNGYLADIGINMMDNLNCLNSQSNSKSLIENTNLKSVSQFWSQDAAFLNKTSLDDENFQKWCQLLGWKPEYNDISCVLNDLALLKDLSK